MKILFTGGGTGGSITPLIAIYQELDTAEAKKPFEFFWIGGKEGIEKEIVGKYNIKYYPIACGKFRRYFSFKNFTDPFRVLAGFFQSLKILHKTKPDIIVVAGSYISVPVVWAARLSRVPVLVHQQDVQVGLANKIMSKRAKKITVSLEESLKKFPKNKAVFTGNPVRKEAFETQDKNYIKNKYKLEDLPTVLFIGGGTGAEQMNKAVAKHMEKILESANVFHITGKGKKIEPANNIKNIQRYHQFEFVGGDLIAIINYVDLVVTRAGMSTLSELAVLGKPTIIVPIPKTHQEKNTNIFYRNNAAIVYGQKYLDDESFPEFIVQLLADKPKLANLSLNIQKMMPDDAAKRVSEIIMGIVLSS